MKYQHFLILMMIVLLSLSACTKTEEVTDDQTAVTDDSNDEVARPAGWTEATHSNDAAPNYEVVFPKDEVNQMTITIAPEDWEAMQANMTELLGEPGEGGFGGPGGFQFPADGEFPELPEGFEPPEGFDLPEGFEPPGDGRFPGGPGGFPGGGSFTSENPMWVEATIEFEGNVWTNVGVRYKGNSSLSEAWRSGSLKMPLKLDFDEFEDEYPEIDNQRFYGFKQLSLANGFSDNTFMNDTITYDLLQEAGLVAAETAYYEVILDYGDGPVSLGLYTVVEVIDDTVIERTFGDDSGNIYEGDGPGATLTENSYAQIADSFQKENNEDEADWSDIEALSDVLNAETRTTDPAAWRSELESVFDVDTFLEWLGISAVLQHWDTYGNMTHNFYLYNDPDTGLLTWISWDHNMILGSGPGGGGFGGPGGEPGGGGGFGGPRGGGSVSLDKAEVTADWPLIRYLLDDPVYWQKYVDYLTETGELFDPDKMSARYAELAALIEPYAAEDIGAEPFATAVQQITDKTYERAQALSDFLAEQ